MGSDNLHADLDVTVADEQNTQPETACQHTLPLPNPLVLV
jgi:hypothetical protein